VILTPDGRKARIRLHAQGSEAEARQTLQIIEKAKGYIRHTIAGRVDVFRVPDLRFEADLSPHLRDRAATLLRRIRKGRPRDPQPAEKNPS
jgi:ribosome-binding factor A